MNLKVFPATINHEGQKVPLINHWREKASNDPVQIRQWLEFFKDKIKFFGAPCGPENGILVLDVDLKHDQNGIDTINSMGLELPETMWQQTPSGGYHFFFEFDPNRNPGNKVKFLKGLDIRSTGGWVAIYNLDITKPLTKMPEWIWQYCQKKEKEITPNTTIVQISPEICMEIFSNALETIRNAGVGESNNTLNVQSYLIGQLVAAGGVNKEYAEQELFKAAIERGKPQYEAIATIRSGIEGGIKNPKTFELPKTPPQILLNIPAKIPDAPQLPERWTPNFMTRSDLFNFSNLRKQQLFENWSTEDIHLTTADGGTGKTTLKLYEAICLALGQPFLGFPCLSPGRTLFITGEDTAAKLSAIIGAMLKQLKIDQDDALIEQVLSSIVIKKDADLCLITKDKQGFLTANRQALDKILEAVHDLKPRMIVFDPIASFWGSESALNDMNKAVAKFMGELQEKSNACVEMINHMGKQSSSQKDLSQFAGRGGSGLPSHARVVRTLQPMTAQEYREKTGTELPEGKSAIQCNIGKFTDGSPLYAKPFIIMRDGYLFERINLTPEKEKEVQEIQTCCEIIMQLVKEEISYGNFPTEKGITAKYKNMNHPYTTKIKESFSLLKMSGVYGEKLKETSHPDAGTKERIFVIIDKEGNEI